MIRFPRKLLKSIRGRLLLIISVLLLPIISMQIYLYHRATDKTHTGELGQNREMAQAFGRAFNNYIENVIHQEFALGAAVGSANFTAEERDRFIEENKKLYPAFLDLLWVDPQGTVLSSHFHRMIGRNLKDKQYVRDVLAGRDWTVSNLYLPGCASKPVFAVSHAVRDKHGQLLGIIAAVIVPEKMGAVLGKGQTKGAGLCLIDGNGRLVYGGPQIRTNWKGGDWANLVDVIRKAPGSGQTARMVPLTSSGGKTKFIAAIPLRNIGWVAGVYKGELEPWGPAGGLPPELAIILLLTLASLGTALGLSRNVSKSIKALHSHCIPPRSGQTWKPRDLFGITELDELAIAFSRMKDETEAREKDLKESSQTSSKCESLFRAIIENSYDAIHFADEKGAMIYRSPSWRTISGYDDNERLEQDTFELLHPDDRPAARRAWADMMTHPGERRRFQHRFRHKDGSWRWVEATAHNLLEDPNVNAVVVIARDITDYKKSEEALRASEERLRLFVEHAPAALAMFDRQMRYIAASRRWLTLHDLGERDLRGLSNYDVIPEIPERWKQINRRALSGEVIKADIDTFERADGSVHKLRWEVLPWHDTKGDVAGILIFSEDITELTKRAEELRISNRALKALSSTVQAIIHAADEPALLNSVCRIIVEECGYHMSWIGFAENDESKTVKPVAQAGFEDNYLESVKITWSDTERGRGPVGTAIRAASPDVCSNFFTEPRMRPWRDEATRRGYVCLVALPLIAGGQTLGALTIYSKEPDSFSQTEVELLAELAENLAYGIADLRLRHAHRVSEKNLQQSQARLDLALRSASMGAWYWEAAENKRYWDEQTCSFFGIDPKTFTGNEEQLFSAMGPENVEKLRNALAKTLETDAPYDTEYRMLATDGEVRSLAVRGKLVRDDAGRPARIDGLIWDITESKRAEEQIRAGRLMLRNVIDGIGDQLILLGRDGVIKMLNKAALDYMELSEGDEAIGRACFEVFSGRSARCEFCEFPLGSLGGDHPLIFERRGQKGTDRFEQVAIYGMNNEAGEPDGAILRITDITEQKLMQEQLIQSEKLASLGLLVAGIAHEINNPNSFIVFNLPILKDYLDRMMPIIDDHVGKHPELEFFGMEYEDFRKDIYDLLKNMEHGSNRISSTVSTLKSFVQKRNKLALRQVRLKEVIEQAMAICGAEIRKNVKSFDVDICQDVERIMTDEEAMEQILINLLINAAHAADKDDSRIGLRVARRGERPGRCMIEISDNGSGMDQKTLEKIFNPFFTTKLSTGTGLGLYICKSLVEGLGGRIEVESTPGEGSVFRIIWT